MPNPNTAKSEDDTTESLRKLKKKRATVRMLVTKYTDAMNMLNNDSQLEEIDYQLQRLTDTLRKLETLDEEYQNELEQEEYERDVEESEQYAERSKRAIFTTKGFKEDFNQGGDQPRIQRIQGSRDLNGRIDADVSPHIQSITSQVNPMGCGSSRSLRVVTPSHHPHCNGKAMVLPLAWDNNHGFIFKKTPLLRARPFPLGSIQIGVQTDTEPHTADVRIQTERIKTYLSSWDTSDAHTQTPVEEGNDELERILAKAYSIHESKATGGGIEETEEEERTEEAEVQVVDAGVQCKWMNADLGTQTEFDDLCLHHHLIHEKDESETNIDNASGMMMSMQSQTEPVARAMAANSADSEAAGVLYVSELLSPFAHLEKELGNQASLADPRRKEAIQDSITKLLLDVEDSLHRHSVLSETVFKLSSREVGVQTDNDPITDESPEYAARPPPCKKLEMIPEKTIFDEIDNHALQAPGSTKSSLNNLVNYLTASAKNELFKVRAFFRWIANNIIYDWKHMDVKLSAEEVLESGEGVCKDYCKLFGEMCKLSNIRVKRVHGFAKGYDYRPGHQFHPGEDITHAWNAVFIFGAWRLIDVTWGTGYTDHTGKFQRKLNEHFFLTDPEVMIWTHYPYSEIESNYSRWQLLDKPLKLEEFNALPKVTPFFFEFNLRIRSRPQNPVMVRVQTELVIAAHRPMRYKFKLYSADDRESGTMNAHVFCQLKEDRLLGCFTITPPAEGTYYFKVYARPEWQMYDDTTLKNVAIFLLECVRCKKHINPYPINDVPWGPTQSFFDFKLKLVNQPGPVIVTWGGKRKLTIESPEEMLITQQVFDASGKELESRNIVVKDESALPRVSFTITPPKIGLYKMMIFGLPKPKEKGKWRLPLLASFLIDCKLSKNSDDDSFSAQKKDKKKRMKICTVR